MHNDKLLAEGLALLERAERRGDAAAAADLDAAASEYDIALSAARAAADELDEVISRYEPLLAG